MPNSLNNFPDLEALKNFIQNKRKGEILITYRKCDDYAGMALAIMIVYDVSQSKYELDLQWMSLGLDLYGDTLQESYLYEFKSIEELLDYLELKYDIKVTDIPVQYQFDINQFPNPIKNANKKAAFEAAWKQFQLDFKKGKFLDSSLQLVYNSMNQ